MTKKYKDFLNLQIEYNGFKLYARDAYDVYKNIDLIFKKRCGWFQLPKSIHIEELKIEYKKLCPQMEVTWPGVVDKIFQQEIIKKLYTVDSNGMVYFSSN